MANLIIYYSRKGENYVSGAMKQLAKGNTEIVAEYIQKAVGGDLFEIETVRDYSPGQSRAEQQRAAGAETVSGQSRRLRQRVCLRPVLVGNLPDGGVHAA